MSDKHKEITVETLSTPPLQIKPAPLARRIEAGFVDSVLFGFAWLIPSVVSGQGSMHLPALFNYSGLASLALLSFVYYFVLEGVFSVTIGKSLLKLMVLQEDGDACSLGSSFKRNLLRFIGWLPFLYLVGAIAALLSADRQRIGDRLAGTVVTEAREKDPNPPPAPFLFH